MLPRTKSATRLRRDLYATLDEVASGEPCMITRKEGDEVLLISRRDYNRLLEDRALSRSIAKGAAELAAGQGIPHAQVVAKVKLAQSKWISSGRPRRKATS